MRLLRRFLRRLDRPRPWPRDYVCVICGHQARLLETGVRPYCRCGNYMTRRDP